MMDVEEKIMEMRKDHVHGSSWYYRTISRLLENIDDHGLPIIASSLGSIRPGMGSISNVDDFLSKIPENDIVAARKLGKKLLMYYEGSEVKLRKNAPKMNGKSVMSISYSSSVKYSIEKSPPDILYLLESRPGKEVGAAYRDYSKYCEVKVVPDSTMLSFMNSTDMVITGFDGIFSDGTMTNKIGTYPLFLCAMEAGVEVIAVGESFKSSLRQFENFPEISATLLGRRCKVPLLERVPLTYVKMLITDSGIFNDPDSSTVISLHESFVKLLS